MPLKWTLGGKEEKQKQKSQLSTAESGTLSCGT